MKTVADYLKNAPKGTKLYSPIFGECIFKYVDCKDEVICVTLNESLYYFSPLGQYMADSKHLGECLLFPSKEVRDWSNFSIKKEEEYNFKPFDKVIVRDDNADTWKCNFFSHIIIYKDEQDNPYNMYRCLDEPYCQCLPFNEETAKLIGTKDDYIKEGYECAR